MYIYQWKMENYGEKTPKSNCSHQEQGNYSVIKNILFKYTFSQFLHVCFYLEKKLLQIAFLISFLIKVYLVAVLELSIISRDLYL